LHALSNDIIMNTKGYEAKEVAVKVMEVRKCCSDDTNIPARPMAGGFSGARKQVNLLGAPANTTG
jgi:hypothetical protein